MRPVSTVMIFMIRYQSELIGQPLTDRLLRLFIAKCGDLHILNFVCFGWAETIYLCRLVTINGVWKLINSHCLIN